MRTKIFNLINKPEIFKIQERVNSFTHFRVFNSALENFMKKFRHYFATSTSHSDICDVVHL